MIFGREISDLISRVVLFPGVFLRYGLYRNSIWHKRLIIIMPQIRKFQPSLLRITEAITTKQKSQAEQKKSLKDLWLAEFEIFYAW